MASKNHDVDALKKDFVLVVPPADRLAVHQGSQLTEVICEVVSFSPSIPSNGCRIMLRQHLP
jgi:hypothetical protein